MRLRISHRTRYTYSRPVLLERHTFRFHPRADGSQRVLDYSIEISPRPALTSECLDAEGNTVTEAWFAGETVELTVHARCELETLRTNAFDFLPAGAVSLPAEYSGELWRLLSPYCDGSGADATVRAFARETAEEAGWDTLRFLPALTQRIFTDCRHEVRAQGDPFPAAVTLAQRSGACRDLAVLFIEACRTLGLAARFVSGYQRSEGQQEEHEMHAWAEVYLPGGGWRGFDPSHGLAAGDSLAPVAAGLTPQDAAPVSGTFRGTGAVASLEHDIGIE